MASRALSAWKDEDHVRRFRRRVEDERRLLAHVN